MRIAVLAALVFDGSPDMSTPASNNLVTPHLENTWLVVLNRGLVPRPVCEVREAPEKISLAGLWSLASLNRYLENSSVASTKIISFTEVGWEIPLTRRI